MKKKLIYVLMVVAILCSMYDFGILYEPKKVEASTINVLFTYNRSSDLMYTANGRVYTRVSYMDTNMISVDAGEGGVIKSLKFIQGTKETEITAAIGQQAWVGGKTSKPSPLDSGPSNLI